VKTANLNSWQNLVYLSHSMFGFFFLWTILFTGKFKFTELLYDLQANGDRAD
jgi:hypothetical protein